MKSLSFWQTGNWGRENSSLPQCTQNQVECEFKTKTVFLQLLNRYLKIHPLIGKHVKTMPDMPLSLRALYCCCCHHCCLWLWQLIDTDLGRTKLSLPPFPAAASTGELWSALSTLHNPPAIRKQKEYSYCIFHMPKRFQFHAVLNLRNAPFNPVFILHQYKNFNIS